MKRHATSIFISLLVHLVFVVALLYASCLNIEAPKEEDKKVVLQLTTITLAHHQNSIKQLQAKVSSLKKIEKEKLKKEFIKPKVKQIPLTKKVEIIKEEPPIKKEETQETKEREETKEIYTEVLVQAKSTAVAVKKSPHESTPPKEIQEEERYIFEHTAVIRKLLVENLYYPRSARERKIVGSVVIEFKLQSDAQTTSIRIVESSHEILSKAAIKTIENLSSKFPRPKKDITLRVPIDYYLN